MVHSPYSTAPGAAAAGGDFRERAALLARFGMWQCDLATEALSWTSGVYDIFGLPRGIAVARADIVPLYEEDARRDMERMRAEAIGCGGSFTLDAQIRTVCGERRWMRLSAAVESVDGRAVRLFGAKQDITEERRAWDRLRRHAERDSLTGLANRAAFEAKFREGDACRGGDAPIAALLLIDLDRFKPVNDRFGHAAGDECLRQFATRLGRIFADAVMVARIGGDEFAVLLRAPLADRDLGPMLREARERLCRPLIWKGRRIDIGASIGSAIVGRDRPFDASRLFDEADTALYAAKMAARDTTRHADTHLAAAPGLRAICG